MYLVIFINNIKYGFGTCLYGFAYFPLRFSSLFLGFVAHLQVNFVDSSDVVRHPAEDETAHAGRDADAHEQNLFVGIWAETLLNVFHLWTHEGTGERAIKHKHKEK